MSEQEQWPALLDSLTEKLRRSNLPHQVAAQPGLEGKVAKVMDNPAVRNRILGWISSCGETKYSKSGATAGRLRDQGNEKFVAKDNVGALKLYTESVICAPEVGPELPLAFGNRSAALFHLGHYQAASDDIQQALLMKYPKNTEHRLHQRRAQCLLRLGQYAEAQQQLEQCRDSLAHSRLAPDRQEAVARDLAALATEAAALAGREKRDPGVRPGPAAWQEGDLPGGSSKLRLEGSGERVRGPFVTATQEIVAGEVVVRERPFCLVLLPEQCPARCSSCLSGPLLAPLACRRCTQPRYCSAACQSEAWAAHHQHECGHLDLLHSLGIGHLALRTVLTATLPVLLAARQQVEAAAALPPLPETPYLRVVGLQHHLARLPEDEQFQYTVTAALLLTLLHRHTAFLCPARAVPGLPGVLRPPGPGQEVDDGLLHYVGGLLLRHTAQLIGNAHAVTAVQEGEGGEVRQVRLATAIYPTASMLNHSCVPAIANWFDGPVLEIRAVRGLAAGAEVTNCYGPHHRRHPYQERQESLLGQYGFRCHCSACSSPEDRHFFVQFSAPLCRINRGGCDGPVEVKFSGPSSRGGVCLTCGLAQDTDSSWRAAQEEAVRSPGLRSLTTAEEEMAARLHRHHQALAQVRDELARHQVEAGGYQEAEVLLRKTLDTTCVRYGEDSVEYGNELLKYTDILAALLNNDEAVNTKKMVKQLETAKHIFLIQYGTNSSQVQEIKDKLEFFERMGVSKEA